MKKRPAYESDHGNLFKSEIECLQDDLDFALYDDIKKVLEVVDELDKQDVEILTDNIIKVIKRKPLKIHGLLEGIINASKK